MPHYFCKELEITRVSYNFQLQWCLVKKNSRGPPLSHKWWLAICMNALIMSSIKGHFTHEPRAVTMKLWEPKRKCSNAVPRHFQNHVVWSRTLKCSAKSNVTRPSTNCYFNEFLFMQVLTHDKNIIKQRLWAFGVPWTPAFMLGLSPRDAFWK